MEQVTLEIPSIRDDENGYRFLFKLAEKIMLNPKRHFDFDFKMCAILEQNAVAMIGGLARYVDSFNSVENIGLKGLLTTNCGVMFKVDTMSQIISNLLIKNNFLSHFTQEYFDGYPKGSYIGYRVHTEYLDSNEIATHLYDEWLSDEKLSISSDLKNEIISRILEIFMNAYGHGVEASSIKGLGVISCGQYDKKKSELRLTVLDFGMGIVNNVQSHLESEVDDIQAMKWALMTGNSTRTDSLGIDMPRGLGFGLLNEFVSLNKGKLSIFSNTCCAHLNDSGEYIVSKMKTPINATLVNISINCDNKHYRFITENDTTEQYF